VVEQLLVLPFIQALTVMDETPPPSLQYGRMNPADHFERPRSEEGHKVIQRWLDNDYSYKWERVQVGYRVLAPRLQRAEELEDIC